MEKKIKRTKKIKRDKKRTKKDKRDKKRTKRYKKRTKRDKKRTKRDKKRTKRNRIYRLLHGGVEHEPLTVSPFLTSAWPTSPHSGAADQQIHTSPNLDLPGRVEVADDFTKRVSRSGDLFGTKEERQILIDTWSSELLWKYSQEHIMNYYIPILLGEEPEMDSEEITEFIDENIKYAKERDINIDGTTLTIMIVDNIYNEYYKKYKENFLADLKDMSIDELEEKAKEYSNPQNPIIKLHNLAVAAGVSSTALAPLPKLPHCPLDSTVLIRHIVNKWGKGAGEAIKDAAMDKNPQIVFIPPLIEELVGRGLHKALRDLVFKLWLIADGDELRKGRIQRREEDDAIKQEMEKAKEEYQSIKKSYLLEAAKKALPRVVDIYTPFVLKMSDIEPPREETSARLDSSVKEGIQFINQDILPPLQDSLKKVGIDISSKRLSKELDVYIIQLVQNTPLVKSAIKDKLKADLSAIRDQLNTELVRSQAKLNALERMKKKSRPYCRRWAWGSQEICEDLPDEIKKEEENINAIQQEIKDHDSQINSLVSE